MPDDDLHVDYCFAFGCPRSGTTVLAQLLHAHQAVVLGLERYKYLLRFLEREDRLSEFTPALFTRQRFFDFRPEDTNIAPPGFAKHYQIAERRLDKGQVRYIGDKVMPPTLPIMQAISDQFPQPKLVFIYRDLLRVASSYNVRAADPDDSWPKGNTYKLALTQWRDAFTVADAILGDLGPDQVFVVSYQGLFEPELGAWEALFSFLGLTPTSRSRRRYDNAVRRYDAIKEKPLALDPKQERWLLDRADTDVVARYDDLFAQSVARYGGSRPASAIG